MKSCSSIQELIDILRKKALIFTVSEPVSLDLELSCITSEVSRKIGPAILFENTGREIAVLANAFGSLDRICMALGLEDLNSASSCLPGILKEEESIALVPQEKAPCHEVVFQGESIDLSMLPVPKCWPGDAGPALTLPVVFTKAPDGKLTNAGMYRMQITGKNSAIMHWYSGSGGAVHYEKACSQGRPLEVAVALGPEPAVTFSACAPLPSNASEIAFASALSKHEIKMTECLHSSLRVPASSQIIIEGVCQPGDNELEGPFGTHTGYYSEASKFPRLRITSVSMRRDAVLPVTVPGPPPQEDCFMAKALERIFLPMLKERFPEIININFPLETVFSRLVFVSMKKEYPGHPANLMHRLWEMGRGMFSRMIWIFDHDVNIQDSSEVLWKMANCTNPARDIIFAPGPTDTLDPHRTVCNGACRIGIDCTEKWKEERDGLPWPKKMKMPEDVKKRCHSLIQNILKRRT